MLYQNDCGTLPPAHLQCRLLAPHLKCYFYGPAARTGREGHATPTY